ncbi:MAG: hypothetical protein B7C24_15885 [Bacteroidetes bacterium 4572_77]|nr:MAG: hypothetical protein B7C24_15885 [Bacteroidetes bacterium 4572_77]
MVSDRLNYYTFIHAFWDIYNKDLPLYISSDAILHALHYSFDSYLQEIEANKLFGYLNDGLKKMKNYSTNFSNTVDSEEYENAMKDLDLYLTIALKLLKPSDNIVCNFEENEEELETLLKNIEELSPGSYPLFSSTSRVLDFSQFKPRGHYAEHYLLEHYFRCMIWLGRTEIQITKPGNEISVDHSPEDLKRMTILTALMCEAAFESGANEDLKYMEDILSYLLGVQDNINVWEVRDIMFDMRIEKIFLHLCKQPPGGRKL